MLSERVAAVPRRPPVADHHLWTIVIVVVDRGLPRHHTVAILGAGRADDWRDRACHEGNEAQCYVGPFVLNSLLSLPLGGDNFITRLSLEELGEW